MSENPTKPYNLQATLQINGQDIGPVKALPWGMWAPRLPLVAAPKPLLCECKAFERGVLNFQPGHAPWCWVSVESMP